MNSIKTCASALALSLMLPVSAFAVPVVLEISDTPTFQQQNNSPCIIGNPSCNNPLDFDYTLIPANTESGSLSSPEYTVQQIRDLVGNVFFVAIDLQEPDDDYGLDQFDLLIDGFSEFRFDGEVLNIVNQGNGFSDYVLYNFDLTNFAASAIVRFDLVFSDAQGAREQFFLAGSPGGTEIPEPATVSLLLASLAGAVYRRRRKA